MKAFARITIISAALLAGSQASASEIDTAKDAVAERLRDPSSAQFRNVKAGQANNGLNTVCGEVNAKNGYGGYAGYQRFITNSDGKFVYLESQGHSNFSIMWITDCPS